MPTNAISSIILSVDTLDKDKSCHWLASNSVSACYIIGLPALGGGSPSVVDGQLNNRLPCTIAPSVTLLTSRAGIQRSAVFSAIKPPNIAKIYDVDQSRA